MAKLRDSLRHQDTQMRKSISPTERLLLTLRFLATGHTYVSLHYQFRLGRTTIRRIVLDTCSIIWENLQPEFLKFPDMADWEKICQDFWVKTNFPNCVGAVDGKHIRIVMPPNTGSKYFNYKKYFSIVLLAVADANYRFSYVDVGAQGSSSDSGIFQHSRFGVKLQEGNINLPPPRPWPHTNGPDRPLVFIGDEAFALSNHLMRPFPQRSLNPQRTVFNVRLSKARKVVECAFGIMANKWRIFHTSMMMDTANAVTIVKAACVLHNFVRDKEGINVDEDVPPPPLEALTASTRRGTISATTLREQLTLYLNSPESCVETL
ncbi:uncharacterized protein [Hyperolius riggenbachi]|uniref:uncharacterized protein n=1 Tax=Hyperolius riggenbachi TaxID=752182 RepID=UPI0035A37FB5